MTCFLYLSVFPKENLMLEMCPPHSCLQSQTLWTLNEDRKPWKILHRVIMLIAVLMSPLSHRNYWSVKPGRYSSSQERSMNFRHRDVDMEKTFWTGYPLIGAPEIIFQMSITPFTQKTGSDHTSVALEKPCNCDWKRISTNLLFCTVHLQNFLVFLSVCHPTYTGDNVHVREDTTFLFFKSRNGHL